MIAAIASFFGVIIRFIYELVNNNYFLSILIFTFLTKLILFPLTLMQIKSTEKMQDIAPKDAQIREKYKNDKQKQAEELSKLYSENKISPMGGCLPLIIQIPIVLAMFYIVKQPLTYITRTPADQIKSYTATYLNKEVDSVTENEMKAYEIQVAKENDLIDMDVAFGINLGDIPSNIFNKDVAKRSNKISLLIPIITVVLSFIQSKLTQKNTNMTDEQKEMQKTNNLTLPLMSGIIAYTMPLALGVYWLFGNILQIFTQLIISKITSKHKKLLELNKGGVVNEKN
mgnify:CR=1 FL=1